MGPTMEIGGALQETIALLKTIPGGPEAVAWFNGWPEFGDAEVVELRLARRGPSLLRIFAMASEGGKVGPPFKEAIFDFTLRDMVDVNLEGFGRQNVIGGLALQRSTDQPVHPSLVGIGLARGEVEIELWTCAGAHGMIRCTIDKIVITPLTDNRARVRQILLHDWDPIGVQDIAAASDEYDQYADRAYVMLMDERATAETIAAYLELIAAKRMALGNNQHRAETSRRVAEMLVALRPTFETR